MTTRSDQLKLFGVLVATALALWSLWPSYEYYTKTPAERSAMEPAKLAELRKKAIKLGLDLQGCLQLLLEVDKSQLSPAEAKDAVERARDHQQPHRPVRCGRAAGAARGEDRITVQLPGLTDRERAIALDGTTARLDFPRGPPWVRASGGSS